MKFYHHPHCVNREVCESKSPYGHLRWSIKRIDYDAAACIPVEYSAFNVRYLVEEVSGWHLIDDDINYLSKQLHDKGLHITPKVICDIHHLMQPAHRNQNTRYYVKREVLSFLLKNALTDKQTAMFYSLTKSEQCVYIKLIKNNSLNILRGGWPDFIAEQQDGSLRFIEVKRNKKDPLNQSQIELHTMLKKVGIEVEVIYSEGATVD